jgi:N-acetylmuramoyl-L-alanine amidase
MKNYKLTETKIGTAKVIVDIVPKGYCIPNTKITPTSITIHMTGNVGASAKNNHNYMKNINKNGSRIASWHFTVDDKEIYQAQSTNYKCYHAGCTSGNNTSIGIEIAMFNDKERQAKAYKNAIELVKILMAYHKFDTSKVKRHYDWTKKHCPAWLQEGKWGYTWSWFKGELTKKEEVKPQPTTSFVVKITVDELNVRSGAGTSYPITTVVKKGQAFTIVEEKNGWGKLKSGAGWISLNSKYVQRV